MYCLTVTQVHVPMAYRTERKLNLPPSRQFLFLESYLQQQNIELFLPAGDSVAKAKVDHFPKFTCPSKKAKKESSVVEDKLNKKVPFIVKRGAR